MDVVYLLIHDIWLNLTLTSIFSSTAGEKGGNTNACRPIMEVIYISPMRAESRNIRQ